MHPGMKHTYRHTHTQEGGFCEGGRRGGIRATSEDSLCADLRAGEKDEKEQEGERRVAGERERERGRKREGPGVGPEGYVGAAPRPEAARHLGHPYIAKYSRVEKGAIVRTYLELGAPYFWIRS